MTDVRAPIAIEPRDDYQLIIAAGNEVCANPLLGKKLLIRSSCSLTSPIPPSILRSWPCRKTVFCSREHSVCLAFPAFGPRCSCTLGAIPVSPHLLIPIFDNQANKSQGVVPRPNLRPLCPWTGQFRALSSRTRLNHSTLIYSIFN